MKADIQSIDQLLNDLARHNSSPGKGITRPCYSTEYKDVCQTVIRIMKELDMKVYMDDVGNIIARKEGRNPELPAVCVGSHLDTVRNGGKFDGAGGVVSGLEVVKILNANDVKLNHPIQIFCFVEEEGTALQSGLLGSRWFNGEAVESDLLPLKYENKANALEVIRQFRSDFSEVPSFNEIGHDPRKIRCFFEVHIEQGPVLETKGARLGVVSAIAGTSTIEVSVSGRADHAGSTPMDLRSDAFEVAAHAAVEMYRYARSFPHAVATVGRLEIPNGSSNRVPDSTWFTLDLRSADRAVMDKLIPHAKGILDELTEKNGTRVEVSTSHFVPPIELNPGLRKILMEKALSLSDRVMDISSGAAHDSLVMAKYFPTAMLFVPSKGGRSHCPEEFSEAGDFALAVDVLVETILELDCTEKDNSL